MRVPITRKKLQDIEIVVTPALVVEGKLIILLGTFRNFCRFLNFKGAAGNITVVGPHYGKGSEHFLMVIFSLFFKLMGESWDRSLAHELLISRNEDKFLDR